MAADTKKSSSRVIDTWKMKKWYKVLAPSYFGSQILGETVAVEDDNILGRTVTTSLMNITGDVKRQNVIGTFEVTKVQNGNAETRLKKIQIAPPSVRRMIRKGKERVDVSLVCATKDNVIVRVKPFLLTRGKTGNSVLTAMRHLADAVIRVEAHSLTFEELVRDILSGKLQKTMRMRLNKLYPLKAVEIRALELTTAPKSLPPIPELPELKTEEAVAETEEEKIEKKVKANAAAETSEKKEETAPATEAPKEEKAEKKAKPKKAKKESAEE